MRILLIAARHNIVKAAKSLGYEIILFENKHRIKYETIELADETYIFDWENHKAVLELATALHTSSPIDIVFAFGEKGVTPAALVKEQLNIKGNPIKPVEISQNKALMREVLNNKNISHVDYLIVKGVHNIKSAVESFKLPFIIKPTQGTASSGVRKVEVRSDLDQIIDEYTVSDFREFIVEECLEGPEYSVETLTFDGEHHILGITEKITTGPPYFVEKAHLFPATDLTPEQLNEIEGVTIGTLKALGHYIGPAHTEIKLTPTGPKVIETHTRPGGDNIPHLVETSFGVDVFYSTLLHLKEEETVINHNLLRYSGVKFNLFDKGTVTDIKGIDEIIKHPNVAQVEFNLKVGQKIVEVKDSFTRQGFTIATGSSLGKLRKVFSLIDEQLKISVTRE